MYVIINELDLIAINSGPRKLVKVKPSIHTFFTIDLFPLKKGFMSVKLIFKSVIFSEDSFNVF